MNEAVGPAGSMRQSTDRRYRQASVDRLYQSHYRSGDIASCAGAVRAYRFAITAHTINWIWW